MLHARRVLKKELGNVTRQHQQMEESLALVWIGNWAVTLIHAIKRKYWKKVKLGLCQFSTEIFFYVECPCCLEAKQNRRIDSNQDYEYFSQETDHFRRALLNSSIKSVDHTI